MIGKINNCHQLSISFNANNVVSAVNDIKRYAQNAFAINIALSILIAVNKIAIGNTKTHFQIKPKTMLIIPRRYKNRKMFMAELLNNKISKDITGFCIL